MTLYETLQLFFMAMMFGGLTGFAWALLVKWQRW